MIFGREAELELKKKHEERALEGTEKQVKWANDILDTLERCKDTAKKVYPLMQEKKAKNEEQERIYQNILKNYYKDSKFVFINMYNKDILAYLKTTSWNLLITDLKDLVISCAECKELNLERKEFLMPDYNYTKLEEKTKVLIDERGGVLNYYKN